MTNDGVPIPRIHLSEGRSQDVETETYTRRDVLKRGAGVGAGLILAGGIPVGAEAAKPKKKPAGPKRGGTLRLATDGTPTGHNFDGLGGPQGGEINIATREMFYERLTWVDKNGKII